MENVYFSNDRSAPYSDLVIVDEKYLFFSGLISADLETQAPVNGTITEETNQIMSNLSLLLERYGSDLDHVIRIEILLRDFSERDEMNKAYVAHFNEGHLPARLCFGGVDLAGKSKIEIMATALKK
ncbi:RidA family protein [uncultured Cloacibacillus sp.]|uniref:RidA family protein n=1 Tax=uncultured Cloacibacillus sp. TaxID=889794 RepID=UPI0026DCFF08|nr:RidA family protein [uncultured Cloacibacillus sp.]